LNTEKWKLQRAVIRVAALTQNQKGGDPPMSYELAYLEETHADGSVKHTYIEPVEEEPIAKPLDPNDAPVYEVVEDFLSQSPLT